MGYYDQTHLLDAKCQNLCYADFLGTKLLPERGIFFDRVLEKLLTFHGHLVDTGWWYFVSDLCRENKHLVREIYVNLIVVSILNPVIRIWGKEVHLGSIDK